MHYAWLSMVPTPHISSKHTNSRRRWLLLLVLPYLGLLFPALYARAVPTIFGFPFFYWYQFAWVIIASAIMGIVYFKTKF